MSTYDDVMKAILVDPRRLRNQSVNIVDLKMCLVASWEAGWTFENAQTYLPDNPQLQSDLKRYINAAFTELAVGLRTSEMAVSFLKRRSDRIIEIPVELQTRQFWCRLVENQKYPVSKVPAHHRDEVFWEKIIGTQPELIKELLADSSTWNNKPWEINMISQVVAVDGNLLQNLNKSLPVRVFETAVKTSPMALEYVPDDLKNKLMCELACIQNPLALKFVPDILKTLEMCFSAVEKIPMLLQYVPDNLKNWSMCTSACEKNPLALAFVPDDLKTLKMCCLSVERLPSMLRNVPVQYKDEELIFRLIFSLNHPSTKTPEYLFRLGTPQFPIHRRWTNSIQRALTVHFPMRYDRSNEDFTEDKIESAFNRYIGLLYNQDDVIGEIQTLFNNVQHRPKPSKWFASDLDPCVVQNQPEWILGSSLGLPLEGNEGYSRLELPLENNEEYSKLFEIPPNAYQERRSYERLNNSSFDIIDSCSSGEHEDCENWQMELFAYYCPLAFNDAPDYGINIHLDTISDVANYLSTVCPNDSDESLKFIVLYKVFYHEVCHAWVEDLCSVLDKLMGETMWNRQFEGRYMKTQRQYRGYIFNEEAICNTVAYLMVTRQIKIPNWCGPVATPSKKAVGALHAWMRMQPRGYRSFINLSNVPMPINVIIEEITNLLVVVYKYPRQVSLNEGGDLSIEKVVKTFFNRNLNQLPAPLYIHA